MEKRFTNSHEWIEVEGNEGIVGVTAYARGELGEIVFIELPEVGKTVSLGEETVILESTKAAADIYAPVSGVIVAVNARLKEDPNLLNLSPEGEGWLYRIALGNTGELEGLMTHGEYAKVIEGN